MKTGGNRESVPWQIREMQIINIIHWIVSFKILCVVSKGAKVMWLIDLFIAALFALLLPQLYNRKAGMEWGEIFIPMLPNQDNYINGFNFQFCSVSGDSLWSVAWLCREHLGKYRNEIFKFNIKGLVDNLLCLVIYLIKLFLHNSFKTSPIFIVCENT